MNIINDHKNQSLMSKLISKFKRYRKPQQNYLKMGM